MLNIPCSSPSQFCISKNAVRFELNALGDPNNVSVSMYYDANIVAHVPAISDLGFTADNTYRKWSLSAFPTHFTDVEGVARYAYVAVQREGYNATVVYPPYRLDLYGRAVSEDCRYFLDPETFEAMVPDPEHPFVEPSKEGDCYFFFIGKITESNFGAKQREWAEKAYPMFGELKSPVKTDEPSSFKAPVTYDNIIIIHDTLGGGNQDDSNKGMNGWSVDKFGNAEFNSVTIRDFMKAAEIVYNRVTCDVGTKWHVKGSGKIKRVIPDLVQETQKVEDIVNNEGYLKVETNVPVYRIKNTGLIELDLEEGEIGTLKEGDMCMQMYHRSTGSNRYGDISDPTFNIPFNDWMLKKVDGDVVFTADTHTVYNTPGGIGYHYEFNDRFNNQSGLPDKVDCEIDSHTMNMWSEGFTTIYFKITKALDPARNSLFKYELRCEDEVKTYEDVKSDIEGLEAEYGNDLNKLYSIARADSSLMVRFYTYLRWKGRQIWTDCTHPQELGSFVAYANDRDADRQQSVYETTTYRVNLVGMCDWIYNGWNVEYVQGDLRGFHIPIETLAKDENGVAKTFEYNGAEYQLFELSYEPLKGWGIGNGNFYQWGNYKVLNRPHVIVSMQLLTMCTNDSLEDVLREWTDEERAEATEDNPVLDPRWLHAYEWTKDAKKPTRDLQHMYGCWHVIFDDDTEDTVNPFWLADFMRDKVAIMFEQPLYPVECKWEAWGDNLVDDDAAYSFVESDTPVINPVRLFMNDEEITDIVSGEVHVRMDDQLYDDCVEYQEFSDGAVRIGLLEDKFRVDKSVVVEVAITYNYLVSKEPDEENPDDIFVPEIDTAVARGVFSIVPLKRGKDGQAGTEAPSRVKSVVFKRGTGAEAPATPVGGSFMKPVPSGWSDGIPAGTGRLWMSYRWFWSDPTIETADWSEPAPVGDSAENDLEFCVDLTYTEIPDGVHGIDTDKSQWGWSNTPTEDAVWMAVSTFNKGEWSPWGYVRIKGENGQSVTESRMFKRSAQFPTNILTNEGSYYDLNPVNAKGWSDGIPLADRQNNPVYMMTRMFTSDGKSPQQDAWQGPYLLADTDNFDICYHPRTSDGAAPAAPADQPEVGQGDNLTTWHDTAQPSDYWMAIRNRIAGVWGAWQIMKIRGENGVSVVTSYMFLRSDDKPSGEQLLTDEGSFSHTNPVNTKGWSDGIPAGTKTLWMMQRKFTSDGTPPQDAVWQGPFLAADSDLLDICYHPMTEDKKAPSTEGLEHGDQGDDPETWHNIGTANDYWMAISLKSAGEWGEWSVMRIKGENNVIADLTNDGDSFCVGTNGIYDLEEDIIFSTELKVYDGDSEATEGVTYEDGFIEADKHATISHENGRYTIAVHKGYQEKVLNVELAAMYQGHRVSAVYSLSAILAGDDGVFYSLAVSQNAIKRYNNGDYAVTEPIVVNVVKTVGAESHDLTTLDMQALGAEIVVSADGEQLHDIEPSLPITLTPAYIANIKPTDYLRFELKMGTLLVDAETIPVVDNGKDGQGVITSRVFKRSVARPAYYECLTTEGSFLDPSALGNSKGWTDGIPTGDGAIWEMRRIFTNDGQEPQQPSWQGPFHLVDDDDQDVCYHPAMPDVNDAPDPPAKDNHGDQGNDSTTWHNNGNPDDVWMAIAFKTAGVWGDWTVTRIKGESAVTVRLLSEEFSFNVDADGVYRGNDLELTTVVTLNDGGINHSDFTCLDVDLNVAGASVTHDGSAYTLTVSQGYNQDRLTIPVKVTYRGQTYTVNWTVLTRRNIASVSLSATNVLLPVKDSGIYVGDGKAFTTSVVVMDGNRRVTDTSLLTLSYSRLSSDVSAVVDIALNGLDWTITCLDGFAFESVVIEFIVNYAGQRYSLPYTITASPAGPEGITPMSYVIDVPDNYVMGFNDEPMSDIYATFYKNDGDGVLHEVSAWWRIVPINESGNAIKDYSGNPVNYDIAEYTSSIRFTPNSVLYAERVVQYAIIAYADVSRETQYAIARSSRVRRNPLPRPRGEWKSGETYTSGNGMDEMFVDIVFYDGMYYSCMVTNSDTTFNSAHWYNGDYREFTATRVFFAQLAAIKNLLLNYACAYRTADLGTDNKPVDGARPTIEISGEGGILYALNAIFDNATITGNIKTPCYFGDATGNIKSGIDNEGSLYCGLIYNGNGTWSPPNAYYKSFSVHGKSGVWTKMFDYNDDSFNGINYVGEFAYSNSTLIDSSNIPGLPGNPAYGINKYRFGAYFDTVRDDECAAVCARAAGSKSVGLYAKGNHAIVAHGQSLFHGEVHLNGGLFLDKVGNDNNNDFIMVPANGSVDLPTPSLNKGRILYVKGSGNSTVTGTLMASDTTNTTSSISIGATSTMFISNGTAWVHFKCEN